MDSFRIVISGSAESEFRGVPFPVRRQLNQRIMKLKEEPRPRGCERLGEGENFRLSTHGWRIVYAVDEPRRTVLVLAILKD